MNPKVFIWHDKYGDRFWNASTPELELICFMRMFLECEENGYYNCSEMNKNEKELYNKAKSGDMKAAKKLIQMRQQAEYEGFSIEEVEDPS